MACGMHGGVNIRFAATLSPVDNSSARGVLSHAAPSNESQVSVSILQHTVQLPFSCFHIICHLLCLHHFLFPCQFSLYHLLFQTTILDSDVQVPTFQFDIPTFHFHQHFLPFIYLTPTTTLSFYFDHLTLPQHLPFNIIPSNINTIQATSTPWLPLLPMTPPSQSTSSAQENAPTASSLSGRNAPSPTPTTLTSASTPPNNT